MNTIMKTPAILLALLLPASVFAQSTAVLQNQQWEAQAAQARLQSYNQQQQQSANSKIQQQINSQQQDIDMLQMKTGAHSTKSDNLDQSAQALGVLNSIEKSQEQEQRAIAEHEQHMADMETYIKKLKQSGTNRI